MVIYMRLKNLPVHRAMREISELIYETCKTYLITQGKFLLLLEVFIAVIIVSVFRGAAALRTSSRDRSSSVFSLVGIAGSYRRGVVRNSRQHVCEFPHCVRFAAW